MGPATVAQSTLDPAGPQAAQLSHLWWVMFWVCAAIFVLVMAVVAAAVLRRKSEPTPDRLLTGSVAFGVAATVAILFALLIVSFITGRAVASTVEAGAVTITITGQQWWWNVEYIDPAPNLRVRTANEIHLPVGRPIVFNLASRDVIHSFWVPNLHGKRDLIPGYQTSFWLQADRPGVYRGQCAEFCGHQHAWMALYVTAESDAEYKRWLAAQREPAVEPISDITRRGRELFLKSTCTQCHTIRGTIAGAVLGPDLTHVASRGSLAAGTLSNTREHIEHWVRDPQQVKPGNRMPPNAMSDDDLSALGAYLEILK